MIVFEIIVAILAVYVVWIAISVGLHQRIPLALGSISLERIPDKAAEKYGNRLLFTTDTPCEWEVPALKKSYPVPTEWSANRIRSTAGYVATLLREHLGLQYGDRVAILKQNHLDIHILNLAIIRAGGIACPMNAGFAASKVAPYVVNIGAKLMISDTGTLLRLIREGASFGSAHTIIVAGRREHDEDEQMESLIAAHYPSIKLVWLEEALEDIPHESSAVPRGKDEPMILIHSSGTTGFPKAVILKNGPQSHAVRGWLTYVHVRRGKDKAYLAVPNNHQAVILTFHSLLLLGLEVHWAEAYNRENFDPEMVMREISNKKYTGFFAFPILYTLLKELDLANYDVRAMRFWASTADATHEAITRKFVEIGGTFRKLGIPVDGSVWLDAQGSSEVGTPSVVRYITPFTRKFDRRIGKPGSNLFGPKIRIATTDGEPLPRGKVGRLEVKGKTVFDGYWNNHAMTQKAIHDQWFFTGDVARIEKDGNLIQLDREVDVIHTRNGDVYSLPIEEVIHKHPAIFDTCVYAARCEDGTQEVAAIVALRNGFAFSNEELRSKLNEALSKGQQISRLDIVGWEAFPIGITGKTLKRVLRERTEPHAIEEANRPIVMESVE